MIDMFGALSIIAGIYTGYQLIKEACEQPIPTENWGDKEQFYKDMFHSNKNPKQVMKGLENGKYKLTEEYTEPHRNEKGEIIIENCDLYKEDMRKYGAYQTYKWVEQGKYNLDPIELRKQRMRWEKESERLRNAKFY